MKKPPFAVAILTAQKKKPVGDPASRHEDDDDRDAPLLDAADDLIDAVKSGDRRAVADALRVAYRACANEQHDDTDDDSGY